MQISVLYKARPHPVWYLQKVRLPLDLIDMHIRCTYDYPYYLFQFPDCRRNRLVEPDIHRYGDALWYCYAVISTAGFGDIVTVTLIGKICSVLLTIYTIFVVAIVTGVVVNFYTQLVEMQQKETLAMFMDKLERLPELSKEELEHISQKVRKFR